MIPFIHTKRHAKRAEALAKFLRFCLIGCLNTLIDIGVFCLLAWLFPTSDIRFALLYNSLGSITASVNSFYWNKYWTFQVRQRATLKEVLRFVLVALGSLGVHNGVVLEVARLFPIFITGGWLWASGLKACAIAGAMLLSFLGMYLWVFARKAGQRYRRTALAAESLPASTASFDHSLSVILPAYNEEVAIAETVQGVVAALSAWSIDFEVIVVNDGSRDRTPQIVAAIAAGEPRVRLINHPLNQGCGAALVSGFYQASKEYVFYMDSDGQFDIHELRKFFPLAEDYDGIFGYRIHRQDTWIRKFNAWGWNRVIQYIFGIEARDIDCAFKLFRADFFRSAQLEARGALLLTEIVYKFARAGYTYTQVGVRHLPRKGGTSSGAKLSVILRAFAELFFYANKWYQSENQWRREENTIQEYMHEEKTVASFATS